MVVVPLCRRAPLVSNRVLRFILIAGSVLWFTTLTARAQQAGDVDPTFGASLGLAGNITGVLLQPDGRVLVRGSFQKGIARLNADGSVNGDFNPGTGAGPDTTGGYNGSLLAMDLQSDGKILVGGEFTVFNGVARQYLARLNADGSIDTGFDPGALIGGTVNSASFSQVKALAVQPDGKVLVISQAAASNGFTPNFMLRRFNLDGSLDTNFPSYSDEHFTADVVTVLPSGKILVAGSFPTFGGFTTNRVVRLNADGSIDTGFVSADTGNEAHVMAVQPDGKIVVSCGLNYFPNNNPNVVRLNVDGSLDTSFNAALVPSTDAQALAVQADGKIIFGGYFTQYVDAAHSHVVRLNADGSLDTTLDLGANDTVLGIAAQADGKVILGGLFTTFGGISRDGVVRVNPDGSVDTPFQPAGTAGPNSAVPRILTQTDGKVIIGGDFTTINGADHPKIARLNTDGSLDTTFQPDASFVAVAMQPDGKVVGNETSGVVRLNTDGSVDASFNPPTGYTAGGLQPDGKLIVNGVNGVARLNTDGSVDASFNQPSGSLFLFQAFQPDGKILVIPSGFEYTGEEGIRRLDVDGSLDSSFTYGLDPYTPYFYTVAVQPDGKLLVSRFDLVNNDVPMFVLTRLNADGSVDTGFQVLQGDGHVEAIAVQSSGQILIGGDFTTCNGVSRQGFARLNADGTVDTTFDAGANNAAKVESIALQADGGILIGGDFNTVGGIVRNYVARLDDTGALDTTFLAGTGPASLAAAVLATDGKVIVAGQVPGGVERLNTDGSTDNTFDVGTGASGAVDTLALQADGKVLVGGAFTAFNGTDAAYLARLLPDGSVDASFAPVINGLVAAGVVQSDGKIVIGGDFTEVNGQVRSGLARLNVDGTLDANFTADVDAADGTSADVASARRPDARSTRARRAAATSNARKVRSLAYVPGATGQSDQLIVGGVFSQVAGVARHGLARLFLSGGSVAVDNTFDPGSGPDATVQALAVQADGSLLVGGDFASISGVSRAGLARLSASGSVDASFDAALQGTATHPVSVHSLSMVNVASAGSTSTTTPRVLVGGSFVKAGNVARQAFARLLIDRGAIDPNFNPGTGADGSVNALVPQPDGRTIIAGTFDSVNGQPHRAVARLLGGSDTVAISLPTVTLTAALPEVAVNGGQAYAFLLALSSAPTADIQVAYTVKGSATPGVDYIALKGTAKVKAGKTSKVIKITPAGDLGEASKKTVKLVLESGIGYTVGTTGKIKVTILPAE